MKKPRKNKSKKEIVSDIQLIEDASRRRALIKDILFPYLLDMKEDVGFTKLFIQSFSAIVDSVFNETAKKTTIAHITPELKAKLAEFFKEKDQQKEVSKYLKLIDLIQDISVQDLAYATELSRYIDGYFLKQSDKRPVSDVDIIAILG